MSKKETKPVIFSLDECRFLGLPLSDSKKDLSKDKAAVAVRKIIDTMPWVMLVADCDYDERVATAAVIYAASEIQLNQAVREYRKNPMPPNSTEENR